MTKEQIEKYLVDNAILAGPYFEGSMKNLLRNMLRDWIMVANALSDTTYEGFVFRRATENIQSALGKDWETVRKELEEQTNEK